MEIYMYLVSLFPRPSYCMVPVARGVKNKFAEPLVSAVVLWKRKKKYSTIVLKLILFPECDTQRTWAPRRGLERWWQRVIDFHLNKIVIFAQWQCWTDTGNNAYIEWAICSVVNFVLTVYIILCGAKLLCKSFQVVEASYAINSILRCKDSICLKVLCNKLKEVRGD